MTLHDLAIMDWKVLAMLLVALLAVLAFLGSILRRARKIDLPFMHVFLSMVPRRRKSK